MKEFELGGANGSANDSGGSKGEREGRALPRGPNSFNFMQFLRKFGKIVCWRHLSPGSWSPLLGEILDPPMNDFIFLGWEGRLSARMNSSIFVVDWTLLVIIAKYGVLIIGGVYYGENSKMQNVASNGSKKARNNASAIFRSLLLSPYLIKWHVSSGKWWPCVLGLQKLGCKTSKML